MIAWDDRYCCGRTAWASLKREGLILFVDICEEEEKKTAFPEVFMP